MVLGNLDTALNWDVEPIAGRQIGEFASLGVGDEPYAAQADATDGVAVGLCIGPRSYTPNRPALFQLFLRISPDVSR